MTIESLGATSGRVSSLSENNSNEPKENTTVYLVFSDEDYYERPLVAVFATVELAEDWVNRTDNPEYYYVESREVLSVLPDR